MVYGLLPVLSPLAVKHLPPVGRRARCGVCFPFVIWSSTRASVHSLFDLVCVCRQEEAGKPKGRGPWAPRRQRECSDGVGEQGWLDYIYGHRRKQ
jgi:hypothetical protein